MARLNLSPDEVAIIEEVRKTKAIWNSAIDRVTAILADAARNGYPSLNHLHEQVQELRK